MTRIKALLAIVIALSSSFASIETRAQSTQERQFDFQRGLRNYQDIVGGRKKLEQLTPQERQEVLAVHRRVRSKTEDGKTAECRDARETAATAARELADRSRRLRNCAEAEDYSEDCSTEFRRLKGAYGDYEDAVSAVGSNCN